jgi:SAM-dependent methyltransferase
MIGQARRRNRAAIQAGRVRLIHTPVERLSISDGPFDAALAVNTVGMWPDPTARLREVARVLRPGGRIALVSQPRCLGATAATSAAAANELAGLLTEAGFVHLRTDVLDLDPPAACVLGRLAPADDAELLARPTGAVMTPGCTGHRPVQRSAPATARPIPIRCPPTLAVRERGSAPRRSTSSGNRPAVARNRVMIWLDRSTTSSPM